MDSGIRDPLIRTLVYSHLWLALGAAAQTWWIGDVIGGTGWQAPVLAFCGTIVCYTYMRWARMDHPDLAGSPQLKWFRENKRWLFVMAATCLGAGMAIAWPNAIELIEVCWPAAIIGLLYVIPLRFTGGRTIGLRRIPMLKAFLIAFAWACTTVKLAAVYNTSSNNFFEPFDLIMQVCFFLSLAVVFDIRDLAYDLPSLRTLPRVLGVNAAKAFAVLLQLPWILFFVVLALLSMEPIEVVTPRGFLVLPMMLPAIGHLICIGYILRARPDRSEAFYALHLDGMLILIPMLGWIGSVLR